MMLEFAMKSGVNFYKAAINQGFKPGTLRLQTSWDKSVPKCLFIAVFEYCFKTEDWMK